MNRFIQLAIIVIAFIYLFYNFDVSKINWSMFNVYGLILTFFLVLLGQIILSVRWQKIANISFISSFEATIVSSFLNMVLPAKLGEVAKVAYLKKFYKLPINKITAALFVERFFDIIVLTIIMLIFFYFYFENEVLKNSIVVLIVSILLTTIFLKISLLEKILKKIPIKFFRVYTQKIYRNINKILKNPFDIVLWSIFLWISYFLSNLLFFMNGVEFNLNINQIIEIFLFSSVVLSVSITPGGIATYEAAMVFILNKYGIDKENAFVAAFTYHFILYEVDFFLFGIFLFIKDIKFKELMSK